MNGQELDRFPAELRRLKNRFALFPSFIPSCYYSSVRLGINKLSAVLPNKNIVMKSLTEIVSKCYRTATIWVDCIGASVGATDDSAIHACGCGTSDKAVAVISLLTASGEGCALCGIVSLNSEPV